MAEVNGRDAGAVAQAIKGGVPADDGPSTARRSASIVRLAAAMAKAQAELKNPPKDTDNTFFKSKYADLATVRDTVTPVLAKYGLAVIQLPCEMGDAPALTTLLTHESGEWVETTIKLRPSKQDPQGVGSAITYARRYALQSVCGVAADVDDDGNEASKPGQARQNSAPANNPALRARVAAAIGSAPDRAALTAVYRQYDADLKLGKLGPDDADHLDPLFKEAGERFPKQPAAAK